MKLCPFCKAPYAKSDEDEVKREMKLMNKGNAEAYYALGGCYRIGTYGLPQDEAKACELYLKAGELGSAAAYYNLGNAYYYGRGLEVDMKKAKNYYEISAMNGNVSARYNLGCMEGQAGNHERAYKHVLVSARAGDTSSLNKVKRGFMKGYITKEQYATTLREYQKSQDEMKSDMRDKSLAARNQRMGGSVL